MEKNYYKIGDDFVLKKTLGPQVKKIKKILPTKFLMIDVGMYIIIPILIALPIGLYLDKLFKTRNLFTLVLIFIGFISSIYNLVKLTKKI